MEEKYQYWNNITSRNYDFIYRMEGLHNIITVGYKPPGKNDDIKRKKGMMDMFIP